MAGGDVPVSSGLNVWIDADGRGRTASHAGCFGGEDFEFGRGFDVEEADARAQGFANCLAGFADPGKDNGLWIGSSPLQAEKLADGDDVESAAKPHQQAQNGKIGVGLDGVTNRVWLASQGSVELAIGSGDARGAIDVRRSSGADGDIFDADALAIQIVLPPGEFGCVTCRINARICR